MRCIHLGREGDGRSLPVLRVVAAIAHRRPDSALNFNLDEVLFRYWEYAEPYYRKDGKPTTEVSNIKLALRLAKQLYGHTLVRDFGSLALKAIQRRMVGEDLRSQSDQFPHQ